MQFRFNPIEEKFPEDQNLLVPPFKFPIGRANWKKLPIPWLHISGKILFFTSAYNTKHLVL